MPKRDYDAVISLQLSLGHNREKLLRASSAALARVEDMPFEDVVKRPAEFYIRTASQYSA